MQEGRAKVDAMAACLLTEAGQGACCRSSDAPWMWPGSPHGALGVPLREGSGGGGALQMAWVCLLSEPGEQQTAGPCWRETKGDL